jgi:hypothetical protein
MLHILSILFRLIVWENIVSLFVSVVPSAVFEVEVANRRGDRFVKDTVRIGLLSIIRVFICFNGCSCLCDNYFGGHWIVLWEFCGRSDTLAGGEAGASIGSTTGEGIVKPEYQEL